MNKKTILRYSESFKIEVVQHYEKSGLTQAEIKKKFGILGGQTLNLWIRKYGKEESTNKVVRVEKPSEVNRLKSLQKENDKLKRALADSHLKQVTAENFLESVSEMLDLSVEDLKKKFGGK